MGTRRPTRRARGGGKGGDNPLSGTAQGRAWAVGRAERLAARDGSPARNGAEQFASLVGAAVPLILKALKQDPALGSGILVTFAADALGFFSFLGIATLLLDRLV